MRSKLSLKKLKIELYFAK
jgi:hypothetical protein